MQLFKHPLHLVERKEQYSQVGASRLRWRIESRLPLLVSNSHKIPPLYHFAFWDAA
jgi:hypothetical protein